MEDLTGKQLGPYRVVAPLGEGGMAAVYKAYQPSMDRYVALKILPRYLASDPEFVGRFEQEAKVLAKLLHPHILPVHDYGEADGYTYIVMPFVEGGTLAGLLHGTPLPLVQLNRVISQVGSALDYAHSRGLIHRDVKPSNVLIDPTGNCLLTDFGIAKMLQGDAHLTRTGGMVGTPAYMSPEQIRGEPLDGRSDIYSLGVVLYEMAVGRPPYRAETPPAILVKHLYDPLPPPRTINPSLPEAVERVILKAMAKEPADRYPTAGAMVEALQAAVESVASADTVEVPTQEQVETAIVYDRPLDTTTEPSVPRRVSAADQTAPTWRGMPAQRSLALAGGGLVIVLALVVLAVLGSRLLRPPVVGVATGAASPPIVTSAGAPPAESRPVEDTPTAAAYVVSTAQAQLTLTAVARTALLADAVPVFQEDFSSNVHAWSVGEESNEYGDFVDRLVDGKFQLSAFSKQPTWNWTWVPELSPQDFWLSVEATLVAASGEAVVGISFRENKSGYYYVQFAQDGSYRLRLRKDQSWNTVQTWTPSHAFRLEPGVTNTFAILVVGSSFTLYANGQELATLQDTSVPEAGVISLVAELPQTGQSVTVDFDNLTIKEVPFSRSVAEIKGTATARAQAQATAQAAPTATALARAAVLANAVLVLSDDFSSNTRGWWVGETSDEYGDYARRLIDGKFRFSMASKQPAWTWTWVPDFSVKDFWFSVDVTISEVSGDADVSITFRENKDGEVYRAQFANDGTYRLRLYQDGGWSTLQEWTTSDAVKLSPGVTNTFAVLAEGPNLTLYANGQELITLQDTALDQAGKVGLGIGLFEAGQTLSVDFDNLVVKELPTDRTVAEIEATATARAKTLP